MTCLYECVLDIISLKFHHLVFIWLELIPSIFYWINAKITERRHFCKRDPNGVNLH